MEQSFNVLYLVLAGDTLALKNVEVQISVCMGTFTCIKTLYQKCRLWLLMMADGLLNDFVFSNFPPRITYYLSNIFKEEEKKPKEN